MSSAVGTKAEYNGKLRELTPVVPPMGEPGICQEEEDGRWRKETILN
jgi:hypothetical protein